MKKAELIELIRAQIVEASNVKTQYRIKLMVRNTKTDEVFPVGGFIAGGDAQIALNAFKKTAPSHLEYYLKKM
jgi:hypothetical protein